MWLAKERWAEIRRHCRAAGREWLLAWRALVDAAVKGLEETEGPEPAPDDFTAVRGIGSTIAARLQQAGITTYAALAGAEPEELAEITGRGTTRITSEGWISQAEELVGIPLHPTSPS